MVVVKRLPPLPTVSDIIRLYGLSAQQKLSQNFLLDLNLTNKIVRYADIAHSSCVCEVGSGPGAITRSILNATNATVLAVEKDRRFLPSLELLSDATNGRLQVCHGDILDFDWPGSCDHIVTPKPWDSTGDLSIIGNLPFSVSIPLLLKWLRYLTTREGPFKYGRTTMTLTFQKEVAERITAPPGHTQRSRLSVMVQSLCSAKQCLTLHSSTFVPRPKVQAVVVKVTPLLTPVINTDFDTLETVVRALFQFRRKMIRHSAKLLFPDEYSHLSTELFLRSGVNQTLRAQQLTLEDFKLLCIHYTELIKGVGSEWQREKKKKKKTVNN